MKELLLGVSGLGMGLLLDIVIMECGLELQDGWLLHICLECWNVEVLGCDQILFMWCFALVCCWNLYCRSSSNGGRYVTVEGVYALSCSSVLSALTFTDVARCGCRWSYGALNVSIILARWLKSISWPGCSAGTDLALCDCLWFFFWRAFLSSVVNYFSRLGHVWSYLGLIKGYRVVFLKIYVKILLLQGLF